MTEAATTIRKPWINVSPEEPIKTSHAVFYACVDVKIKEIRGTCIFADELNILDLLGVMRPKFPDGTVLNLKKGEYDVIHGAVIIDMRYPPELPVTVSKISGFMGHISGIKTIKAVLDTNGEMDAEIPPKSS